MQEKDTFHEKLFSFFDSRDSLSENNDTSTSAEPEFVFGDIPTDPSLSNVTTSPSSSKEFKGDLIEQIIQICISYSLISSLFNYTIRCDELLSHLSIDIKKQNTDFQNDENNYVQTANNIFDLCVHNLYCKALKNFQKFAEKCKMFFIRESNKSMLEDFQRLTFFINNFKNIFLSIFPKKGTMVHFDTNNHNDNESKEKSLLPELNLIGADVAHYLNESVFSYEPTYEFRKDILNFQSLHQMYIHYMNRYQNCNNVISIETLNEIKSLKYYLQVSCVMNMYKFLLCVNNLNYEEYIEGKGYNTLQNAFDRIEFHTLANEIAEEDEVDDDDDDFEVLVM